jgi:ABC-type antimicrobial peptide transport system permease subunit
MLGKAPALTLAAVFAFGLGIAAATAMLSVSRTFLRFLSSRLYGVGSSDFVSFISGAIVLTAVVLLACFLPARRATRVDAMIALGYE